MSFPSQIPMSVCFSVAHDPAADQVYATWRAPAACEVTGGYITTTDDMSAATANYFSVLVYNGGSIGTATTDLGGTVGGTAGWTGGTPKSMTINSTNKNLAAGDVVTVSYSETGTGTFGVMCVQLDYKIGS